MTNVYNWSTTPADNDDADGSLWPEGMSPAQVNNSARDNMASLARFLSDIGGKTATTGSSNAYVFTPATPIEALVNGLVICIRANHTNTDAATINVNALGVKKIRRFDDSGDIALAANDILSGNHYLLQYNEAADSGTGAWVILNPSTVPAALTSYDNTDWLSPATNVQAALEALAGWVYSIDPTAPDQYVRGLTLSNNSTDANNDIDIAAGRARGNSVTVTNSATLTKRLDASWAAGTNQGGLDTGSKANSTTYHVHAIRKDEDGTFDALFSTSVGSPTMPSGWTRVQRLGAVLTDGSGNIRSFVQNGNDVTLVTSIPDMSGGLANDTPTTVAISVAGGVKVRAKIRCSLYYTAVATVLVTSFDEADRAAALGGEGSITNGVSNGRASGHIEVITNASRQIRIRASTSGGAAVDDFDIVTYGWVDFSVPRIGA